MLLSVSQLCDRQDVAFGLKSARMLHLMMQPSDVLFLHHLMVRVCLLLLQSLRGQAQAVVGPSQPVVSILGDDITLPCHLKPAVNALDLRLEWARPDLSPGFVHVWANGQERVADKQPSYEGRTSLSPDGLEHGDVSLTLSRVKLSDEGTYRCLVPSLGQATFVKLVVGAVSSPVTHMTKLSSQLLLQCESKGWYPEPEVLWLDGEGNLLPAGPTETVRGPDGLYTVSSRVTVEKRHSNSFTCRVQQKIINQTRETHIQVPVLSWKEEFVLTLGFIGVVLCAVFSVRHWTLSLRRTNVCVQPQQMTAVTRNQQEVQHPKHLQEVKKQLKNVHL